MAVSKKTSSTSSLKKESETKTKFDFAFERINYIWMLVGIVLLALGYILLVGGGAKNPNEFNYALFDTQRLIIAPIFMVAGIVVEIYAIMIKGKSKSSQTDNKE